MLAVLSPSIKLRCPLQANAIWDYFRRADFPSSRVGIPACGLLLTKKTLHRVLVLAGPAAAHVAHVALAAPAVRRAAAPARVDRAALVRLVVRAGPVAARARVDHVAPAALAALVALALAARVDHVALAVPAALVLADHADLAGHAGRVGRVGLVDRAALVAPALAPLSALQRSVKENALSAALCKLKSWPMWLLT